MMTSRIRIFQILVAATAALSSMRSYAVVDMKEANYNDTWTDILIQGTNQLRVQRYYNSRSVFNGMFGFGWCSDFETSIERTPEGGLRVLECGDGKLVFFTPENFDAKSVAKSIDDVMNEYKKKNGRATPETLKLVRAQIATDAASRAELARDLKMAIPESQKGISYKAEGMDVERIVFDGSAYTRTLTDGVIQKFDKQGRLIGIYDKSLNYQKLTWADTGLKDVIDNRGRKLTFVVANRRVREVQGPNNTKTEYKYKGENLVEVTNMWKNTYKYDYDEGHNLTKILYPDGTYKAMTYNLAKDWITSYTENFGKPNPCTETYEYQNFVGVRSHSTSSAVKKCGKEIKNKAQFDFWYETTPEGKSILSRVATKSMTDSLDIQYHPKLGRPLVIKRNGVTTSYDYYPSGLVKRKDTSATKMHFTYSNENNKVAKVLTEYVDQSNGKTIRKRETSFDYDKKGNLIKAFNSDGQSIHLTYDERGRIATMLDQAKKEVLIKYDERTGKPFEITRPNLGTIKINYKPNGDINKVDSPDGPSVAVQIASTFNNLLDIISPATSELEL